MKEKSRKTATVVKLRGSGPSGPPPDNQERLEQYITDRVADLLVLAATLYEVDYAKAGNEIVHAVIAALEQSDVHVSRDLEPLRTLMEITEEVEREITDAVEKPTPTSGDDNA